MIQRVTIARSLIPYPEILIPDDFLSAVDAEIVSGSVSLLFVYS